MNTLTIAEVDALNDRLQHLEPEQSEHIRATIHQWLEVYNQVQFFSAQLSGLEREFGAWVHVNLDRETLGIWQRR